MNISRLSIAGGAVLALTLSACAGSAGQQSGDGGNGSGYEYGADQNTVDEALSDLEPVTLKYQTPAASPNSIQAKDKIWADGIKKRSGGKITVEIVYGQAIAGFDEIHDALADGRVDLAYTLPGYDPSRFPVFDDLSYSLSALPGSPYSGELVANAVGVDLGWQSEELLKEFEDQDIYPLAPINASATPYPSCNKPGATAEDWKGRQFRAGSRAQEKMVSAIGSTPVSLEYVEVYEALQRKTIDCALSSLNSGVDYGFLDVSPHVSYTTETSIPRAPGATLAGSKVANLPLAYQQVIFDSMIESLVGTAEVVIDGNYEGVKKVHELDGSIEEMDDKTQKAIADTNDKLIAEIAKKGGEYGDLSKRVVESGKKWKAKIDELGYTDDGDFDDLDKWYDDSTDFRPFAKAVYEDAFLPHRPE